MKHMRRQILFVIMILGFAAFAWGCGAGGSAAGDGASDASKPAKDLALISGLDGFIGGWGHINGTELNVVTLFDEDGKLKAEFGSIPGGGYYATFEPADVTIDGDTLRCTNGEMVMDGGAADDALLVGKPSESEDGEYEFLLESEAALLEQGSGKTWSYSKVAETQAEMDEWIEETNKKINETDGEEDQ